MNRYTILGQLGDGSFGTVNKAQHTTSGEIVAIKKMKQRFKSWEECLQLREIQSLRKLQHFNLIKLKEVIRENTELFLIFDYCEKNIFHILRQRAEEMHGAASFNDKEIRSIMCQTLLGIQAVHKGGFMHRDLKPENLLVKGDLVKVADFGLAKEIRSRPPFTEYIATRWYRAPEIILHSPNYNSPVDIWACGVIFAELFLCRPLFPGTSECDQLFKICSVLGAPSNGEWEEGYYLAKKKNIRFPSVTPTPLSQLLHHAPSTAVDLIEKMLRFNPADRPTATQCLQHPFFTGTSGSSALYAGISTGQPHNPFLMASNNASSNTPLLPDVRIHCNSSPPPSSIASMQKYASLFQSGSRSPCISTFNQIMNTSRKVPPQEDEKGDISDDEFNF